MISHILHTAFEAVYESENHDNDILVEGEDGCMETNGDFSGNFERGDHNESISMILSDKKAIIKVRLPYLNIHVRRPSFLYSSPYLCT